MKRIYEASDASDVFEMETSTKDIDKACKLMQEAILILKKFEGALSVKKLKSKVDDETGIPIDSLIETVSKAIEKTTSYAVEISVLKENVK